MSNKYIAEIKLGNGYRCICCIQTWNIFITFTSEEEVNKFLDIITKIKDKKQIIDYHSVEIYEVSSLEQELVYEIDAYIKHKNRELPDLSKHNPIAWCYLDWCSTCEYKYANYTIKYMDGTENEINNTNSPNKWEHFKTEIELESVKKERKKYALQRDEVFIELNRLEYITNQYDKNIQRIEKTLEESKRSG